MRKVDVVSRSRAETVSLGRAVGARLASGDVVALYGDLGAGKTVFAKGIATGAGVPAADAVTSPSFTLLNEYRGRDGPIFHLDLYRLTGAGDLRAVSMEELLTADGIVIVEWAERAAGSLPGDRLDIRMEHAARTRRRISFRASEERLGRIMSALDAFRDDPATA